MPGAVRMLPLLAAGLAPIISRKSVRSTSGMGISSGWPSISSAARWCGSWSTLVAEKRLCVSSALTNPPALSSVPLLWTLGLPWYTPTESGP